MGRGPNSAKRRTRAAAPSAPSPRCNPGASRDRPSAGILAGIIFWSGSQVAGESIVAIAVAALAVSTVDRVANGADMARGAGIGPVPALRVSGCLTTARRQPAARATSRTRSFGLFARPKSHTPPPAPQSLRRRRSHASHQYPRPGIAFILKHSAAHKCRSRETLMFQNERDRRSLGLE